MSFQKKGYARSLTRKTTDLNRNSPPLDDLADRHKVDGLPTSAAPSGAVAAALFAKYAVAVEL
jgi:hypothetical protein